MNSSANRALSFVLVLQGLILMSLWTGHTLPHAQAQIPDPGAQRERQVEELKALNSKMDKLLELLSSGKVQVQVQSVEKK